MREAGGIASSGMAIFRCSNLTEAIELGTQDPTVQSGMLTVEVRPWWVPFHEYGLRCHDSGVPTSFRGA